MATKTAKATKKPAAKKATKKPVVVKLKKRPKPGPQAVVSELYIIAHRDRLRIDGRLTEDEVVPAMDGAGTVAMAIFDKKAAVREARRQSRMYGLDAVAVRVTIG